MDFVTPHQAVGLANSLAADVFWQISSQSYDEYMWDPRLEITDGTWPATVVQAHLGVNCWAVGSAAAMDSYSSLDPLHSGSHAGSGHNNRSQPDTSGDELRERQLFKASCSERHVHRSALRPVGRAGRSNQASRTGHQVSFSPAVEFWFPAQDQILLKSTAVDTTLCKSCNMAVLRQHNSGQVFHARNVTRPAKADIAPDLVLSQSSSSRSWGTTLAADSSQDLCPQQTVICCSTSEKSLQGGSCRSLVTAPHIDRPPTPPIPCGRWARSFGHTAVSPVVDVSPDQNFQSDPVGLRSHESPDVQWTSERTQFDETTFAVFDVLHHSRVLRCRGDEPYADLAAIAFAQTPLLGFPRSYRVVQHNVVGFPNRQIVIWGRRQRNTVVFPIAFQTLIGRVCTVEVPKHATALQALEIADRYCMVGGPFLANVASSTLELYVNGVAVQPHVPSLCEFADTAAVLPSTSFPPIVGPPAAVPTHFRTGRWRLPFLLQRSRIDPNVAMCNMPLSPPHPMHVSSDEELESEVASLTSTLTEGHALFTVFDVHHDVRLFVRSTTANIWDLVELVAQTLPDVGHGLSYRILRYTLPGWPEPQLVVWHGLPPEEIVLPVKAPTSKGVCTVQMQHSASAFAFTVQEFQSVARQESTLMVNWQPHSPFADYCLLNADSAALSDDSRVPLSIGGGRRHRVRSTLQVFSRKAFSDGEHSFDIYVHSPCRHSCRVEVPSHYRPHQVMQTVAAAVRHPRAGRLLFLENSPVCYGTPPHAIVVDSHNPPEGYRWALFDLRRLCTPPYPSFFVLPVPSIVDLPWIRAMFQQNFPRLSHHFAAYLDETLLDRPCAVQASVPLVTVLPLHVGCPESLAQAVPVLLDTCGELVCRTGYQALFFAASSSTMLGGMTSTTTTTGVQCLPRPEPPFGALIDPLTDIQRAPLWVFMASSHTRYVSCSVSSNVVLEDLLSYLTVQLGEVHETYSADRYGLMPRIFFSPDGHPTLFLTASNAGSPITVWVDARPFLPQPVLLVVYPPIMIRHICDLLRRPDLRQHYWSWNGIVWEHSLVFMRRGDVITVRPHKSALFNAPINLLRLRVIGVQVLLLELTGPSLPDADPSIRTAIQLTTSQIRGHWAAVCAATEPLFGDRFEFSKVLLLGFGLPPIRCSARTRLPPTEQQMQSAYDLHLAPIFGPREWLDTGQIDGEHCIFVDANSQGHRQRPWLVTLGYGHEAYLADDQGLGLADAPTPHGTRLRPVWYSTHFGRATMCDASAPDSPLHREEHTDPAQVIVVRPDLLRTAAPHILATPDDDATQASLEAFHEELMQIDREIEARHHAASNTASSASDVAEDNDPAIRRAVAHDSEEDDGTSLMQREATSQASSSSMPQRPSSTTPSGTLSQPLSCAAPATATQPASSTGRTEDLTGTGSSRSVRVQVSVPSTMDFTQWDAAAGRITEQDRQQMFTLFDSVLQTRLVKRHESWTTADCQRTAMSLFPHLGPHPTVKQLAIEVDGLPRP